MAVKKITWRWLLNSFGVVVIIILVIEIVFALGISRYYYDSVRQSLGVQADLVSSTLAQYYEDVAAEDFYPQMRDYVARFSEKEQMELMTIDASGTVLLTSSGFTPDESSGLADYEVALTSGERTGEYIGRSGEQRVMAISVLTAVSEPSLSAVRVVTSLENVDRQIAFWIILVVLLGVAVLFLVLFSSSYFISSIVNPIGDVGAIARRIAAGDFEAQIEKKNNDEIGDLCDTINYMAQQLGEAERIKNDFISSVSHELRTPLTAIQGWGETLLSDDGQDKEILRRGMGVIIGETTRLSQMVEELLDFSRMQSGRLKMEMARCDVLAELSDVVLMYTERAKREDISLVYNDNDLLVPITGDKNKLRQVFVNVIDNAIKYSDGGGTVRVNVSVNTEELTIEVKDTGIGIRAEDLSKVKTKFFKANTTRRSSGIGLAVADEIVARHGGSLDIDSDYGKGTRVVIKLPLEHTAASPEVTPEGGAGA